MGAHACAGSAVGVGKQLRRRKRCVHASAMVSALEAYLANKVQGDGCDGEGDYPGVRLGDVIIVRDQVDGHASSGQGLVR